MPITYKIDPVLGIVISDWHGVVSEKEITDHMKEMLSDKEAFTCGKSIADLRKMTELKYKFDDIYHLSRTVIKPLLGGRRWKTAIIVNNTPYFAIGLQFEWLTEGIVDSSVFTEESAAFNWII